MTYEEYLDAINPLIARFGIPQGGEEAIRVDFEIFQCFEVEDFRLAIRKVLREHNYQSYPTQAEILSCLDDVLSSKQIEEIPAGDVCPECLNFGISYNPMLELARFCGCEKGQRKREFFLTYCRTGDLTEAKRAAKSIEPKSYTPKKIYQPRIINGKFCGYEFSEEISQRLCEKIKKDGGGIK